ncbi:MAG: hypothetical protein WCI11_13310 [Candidatus Methylumidiphilus sp.]
MLFDTGEADDFFLRGRSPDGAALRRNPGDASENPDCAAGRLHPGYLLLKILRLTVEAGIIPVSPRH